MSPKGSEFSALYKKNNTNTMNCEDWVSHVELKNNECAKIVLLYLEFNIYADCLCAP